MALLVNSSAVIRFAGVLDTSPSVNLKGTALDIYVDGVLWSGQDVVKTDTYIEITFDAVYITQQRTVTFKTTSGTALSKFAVKAQCYAIDDVVVREYLLSEPVPVLPTYSQSTVQLGTTTPLNTGITTNICFDINGNQIDCGTGLAISNAANN